MPRLSEAKVSGIVDDAPSQGRRKALAHDGRAVRISVSSWGNRPG